MTLQELRFIVALAREKHFGKASRTVHISQPSLSIAVQKLENELGVTLFERDKNQIKITQLGEDIVERAKRVLEGVEDIKQVAIASRDPLSHVLRLGAIFTVGPYILPSLITELNKVAPRMPIEIKEDYTANLQRKLLNGEVDVILVSLPFSASGILTRVLYKESFVVLLPHDHVLARYKIINEKMLGDQNVLILGEGHCFRDQVVSSCPACFTFKKTRAGIDWKTVEGSSLETIRHMVAAKMGITILPASVANTGPYRDKLLVTRSIKGFNPQREIILAWRKNFPRVKAIEVILQAVSRCKIDGIVK